MFQCIAFVFKYALFGGEVYERSENPFECGRSCGMTYLCGIRHGDVYQVELTRLFKSIRPAAGAVRCIHALARVSVPKKQGEEGFSCKWPPLWARATAPTPE